MLQDISLVEMQIYPQENVKMSLREGVQRNCLSLTKRLIEPLGSPIFGVEITNSKYIECN